MKYIIFILYHGFRIFALIVIGCLLCELINSIRKTDEKIPLLSVAIFFFIVGALGAINDMYKRKDLFD
jgi:hypothetical protein